MKLTRWMTFGLIFLVMIFGAVLSLSNLLHLVTFWLALVLIIFGFRYVKAEPPHKAIVTFLGKRTDETKNEGLRWIIPLIEGLIHVNVEKKNQDLGILKIRTPDMALLNVPVSMTWTPDSNNMINYLNSGGETGVRNILRDIAIERIRTWAMNSIEGPQTFKEAMSSKEEAVNTIIKTMAGDNLGTISSGIPTLLLLNYFNIPKIPPKESEKLIGGENWENMDNQFIKREEDKDQIEREIRERKRQIKDIQGGNGKQQIPQLGIILNRLNIGDIDIAPDSDLARAVQTKIKEESERTGEITELEHVATEIKKLMDPPLKFSLEQALEIVQTERKKVGKNIYEVKGLDIAGAVAKFLGGVK